MITSLHLKKIDIVEFAKDFLNATYNFNLARNELTISGLDTLIEHFASQTRLVDVKPLGINSNEKRWKDFLEIDISQNTNSLLSKYGNTSILIVFIPVYLTQRQMQEIFDRIKFKCEINIIDLQGIENHLKTYDFVAKKHYPPIKVWHLAFEEIALQLSEFKKKHGENSSSKLFHFLNHFEEFRKDNTWFTSGIERFDNKSLDPIQIFASFNHSKSSERSRLNKISLILKIFNSPYFVEEDKLFFSGCPTIMMSRIINTRHEKYQQQIWDFFSDIHNNGIEGLKSTYFEQYKEWYGVDLASFSIFLFWLKSDQFVPLDKYTRTFVVTSGIIENSPKSYDEYLELCSKIPKNNVIREVVKIALDIQKGFGTHIYSKQTSDFLNQFSKNTKDVNVEDFSFNKFNTSLNHPFKIIAIRPERKGDYCNNVHENFFKFYKNYSFVNEDDKVIEYDRSNDLNFLYKLSSVEVQISAVVGKNGSGKSTLTELLYLIIYRLAQENELNEFTNKESFYVDLYFYTDNLYKISVRKEELVINKYDLIEEDNRVIFKLNNEDITKSFNRRAFFYTIAVNYSLYGLNEKNLGDWVNPLFHKNDGYQTPLVLNPKREEGKIDVNKEESLAINRLLAYILNVERFDVKENNIESIPTEEYQPPEIVEGKRPKLLNIKLNFKKLEKLRRKYVKFELLDANLKPKKSYNWNDLFEIIWNILNREIKANSRVDEVKEYLVYKAVSIGITYKKFEKYFDDQKSGTINFLFEPSDFFNELIKDSSHKTFKFWQAVNFLIHGHLRESYNEKDNFSVYDLSYKISKLRIDESEREENKNLYGEKKYDAILFIPPSIFDVEILFENMDSFKKMSSGEKQSIFAINTVAYHLYNIDSIAQEEADKMKEVNYPYVNILFDEVELYFHPDMQRNFISDLLTYFKNQNFENILKINFQFITHSPFILSDIPSNNVLMIEDGKPIEYHAIQSFGANIHDLLHTSFFMKKSFMGEHARVIIEDLINYLTDEEFEKKQNFEWNLNVAWELINIIGEPFLKSDLIELYKEKQQKEIMTLESIEQEIRRLQDLKIKFKNKDDSDT